MRFALMALALMTLPVAAQDTACFAGMPKRVSYSDGRVVTIIQHHGDDVTYTTPYEGYQDSVTKTHLMLFPKLGRQGARATEWRWTSRLPGIAQMVPGFSFDLKGSMASGGGEALPYRAAGQVLAAQEVMVGKCPYAALVVVVTTYLDDQPVMTTTHYLSPDMKVIMKIEAVPAAGGAKVAYTAVRLE